MSGTFGIDGLISGLDTTELIKELPGMNRRPVELLEQRKYDLQTQNDAWREVNSRLYSLREAAYDLQSILTFRGRSAAVTNEDVLTASAGAGTQNGVYNIEVSGLARAHSIGSDTQANAGDPLGQAGTVRVNGEDIEITTEDTLESIAQKINSTAGVGVNASVVQVGEEDFRLVLTAVDTGKANEITLSDDGDVLAGLGLLDAGGEIKNELQAAEDAVLKVNGLEVSRAGNIIDDLITDVTLELKEAGAVTLTVDVDEEQVVTAVQNFVEKYNSTVELIQDNLAYNAESENTGTLFGDSTLIQIQSQLRGFLSRVVEGVDSEVSQLGLVGIQTASGVEGAKSGRLEFDEDLFREKLDTHFNEITKLFGAETVPEGEGIFAAVSNRLFEWTRSGGLITAKTNSLDTRLQDVEDNIQRMEERLGQREEFYMRKFIALESTLSRIQTQSNWLTSQLAALNSQWNI